MPFGGSPRCQANANPNVRMIDRFVTLLETGPTNDLLVSLITCLPNRNRTPICKSRSLKPETVETSFQPSQVKPKADSLQIYWKSFSILPGNQRCARILLDRMTVAFRISWHCLVGGCIQDLHAHASGLRFNFGVDEKLSRARFINGDWNSYNLVR